MTTTPLTAVSRPEPAQAGVRWGLAHDAPVPRECGHRLVAVASSRGESVDQVFEETGEFYLYEISSETTSFIGRQLCPLSRPGATPADTVRLLCDCDLVLCAGIGAQCRRMLDGLGVVCSLEYTGMRLEQAVVTAGRPGRDG